MCGVVCYWAKEAVLTRHQYDLLLKGAEQRGQDGFGVYIITKNDVWHGTRTLGAYSDEHEITLDFIEKYMEVGSILVASCRATPETEKDTDWDTIQPILSKDNQIVLSHNGGVTDSIKDSLDYEYQTKLDSEAIIAAYVEHGRNMKQTMEFLSGSFAFVMMDSEKGKLYGVTSFNPLAHMYIKGYGYFYHSNNDVLAQVLESITGSKRDGMNVWESWYHHYLPGYTIIETDIDSGMQSHTEYTPRFLHPHWKPAEKEIRGNKTYVIASGGIDSGLTAYLLKLVGRDVTMIHFNYWQKAAEAEDWAIVKLSEQLGLPYINFNLFDIYQKLVDPSMLLKEDIPITSGGDDIKSTIAWVAGRNAIFVAIVLAFAETSVFNWNYSHVDIAAGWAQLSEETGGYPDNSHYFVEALNMLKDYGYITGKRIHFLPVLQRITKTESWKLGDRLGFPFDLTVSCDNPKKEGGKVYLCPDCGSTKLSIIAADRANVRDLRHFTKDRPKLSEPTSVAKCRDIIDRLILSQHEKEKLRELI